MIKIKDQGTPFARTIDMTTSNKDQVVKTVLAQWNNTGIVVVYKGNAGAH